MATNILFSPFNSIKSTRAYLWDCRGHSTITLWLCEFWPNENKHNRNGLGYVSYVSSRDIADKIQYILVQAAKLVRVWFISFQLAPVQETAQLTQADQCILLEWCEIPKASMREVCAILLKNLKEEERLSWNISMRLQRELHNNPLKVT